MGIASQELGTNKSQPEKRETTDPYSIAVSIIAHYPNYTRDGTNTTSVRGNIALQTIQAAVDKGYQFMMAVSNETPQEFVDKIPAGANVLYGEGKVDRARASIREAAKLKGVGVVFLTQPEKEEIIPFIPRIAVPILSGKADLVIPKRNEQLFKETFPPYMYQQETDNNHVVNRILRNCGLLGKDQEDLDLYFGVCAFANKPEIVKIFLKTYQFTQGIKGGARKYSSRILETGAGISIIPLIEMIEKYRVASVEVPFHYSEEQKQDEEDPEKIAQFRQKRREQRFNIITEMIHYLRLRGYGNKESLLKPLKTGEEI